MNLPDDIVRRTKELFTSTERKAAMELLSSARIHDGSPAESRLQRCALVASNGSLEKLQYYVRLLAVDYRDVVVAGEYESKGGKLARIRDLTEPF